MTQSEGVWDWFKISHGAKSAFGKHLKNVRLGSIKMDIQDEMIQTILSQKDLKTLRVSLSDTDTVKEFLRQLPKHCKKLEKICFDIIHHGNDMFDVPIIQAAFDLFFEEMKVNLKGLAFNQVVDYYQGPYHNLDYILNNLGLCQNLEELELWDSTNVTNSTLSIISKLQNLKHLRLRRLMSYATGINTLFQVMNLEKLELLDIGGSQCITEEILCIFASKMPPNLKEIRLSGCPLLEIRESTLTNLKNCPKLKKLGFEKTNLSGISNEFLRVFNEQMSLYFYEYEVDSWIDLNQKLRIDHYKESISKISRNGQLGTTSLWNLWY